jgi:hypothetical protein
LGGLQWIQQDVTYTYQWTPGGEDVRGASYQKLPQPEPTGDIEVVRLEDGSRALPCGPAGLIGQVYGADPTDVCEGQPVCSDSSGRAISSRPCAYDPITGPKRYWQRFTRVIGILGCVEQRPHTKVATPDIDLDRELHQSRSQNDSPFELEDGVWLGGSDFQLRAITRGREPMILADRWVELASWGAPDAIRVDDVPKLVGRFSLAQAEYFFDLRTFKDFEHQDQRADRLEWLWNQGWVARMRSFRLNQREADGPRQEPIRFDAEQLPFAKSHPAVPGPGLSDCKERGCAELGELLGGDSGGDT